MKLVFPDGSYRTCSECGHYRKTATEKMTCPEDGDGKLQCIDKSTGKTRFGIWVAE